MHKRTIRFLSLFIFFSIFLQSWHIPYAYSMAGAIATPVIQTACAAFTATAVLFSKVFSKASSYKHDSLAFQGINTYGQKAGVTILGKSQSSITIPKHGAGEISTTNNIDIEAIACVTKIVSFEQDLFRESGQHCNTYSFSGVSKPKAGYHVTDIHNGFRIDTDAGFGCSMQRTKRPWHRSAHFANEEALGNLLAMDIDPIYKQEVIATINQTVAVMISANSEELAERIQARLALAHLNLHEPYSRDLVPVLDTLQRHYFFRDGQLRSTQRDNFMQPLVHEFIKDMAPHVEPKFIDHKGLACISDVQKTSFFKRCGQAFCDWLAMPNDLSKVIRANEMNHKILECLNACQRYDFEHAQHLLNQCDNSIMQEIYQHYYAHYRSEVYDEFGIYRQAPHDPWYMKLSRKEKRELAQDAHRLEALNNDLICRAALKRMIAQQWCIEDTAPAIVHQALYELLSSGHNGLSDIHTLIDTLAHLTQSAKQEDNRILINAFYLANGVMKDFAHYPIAKNLVMPQEILYAENTAIRRLLNHLVYLHHAYPQTVIGSKAQSSLDYITKIVQSKNDRHIKALNSISLKNYDENSIHEITNTLRHTIDPHKELWGVHAIIYKMGAGGPGGGGNGGGGGPPPPQPPQRNNNNNSKKPKNNNNNQSKYLLAKRVAGCLIPKLMTSREYYQELELYFNEMLVKHANEVSVFQKITNIRITAMDFKHIFEATIKRKGTGISGYHSMLLYPQHVIRVTRNFSHGKEVLAGIYDKTGRLITDSKTLFLDKTNGFEIIDAFFTNCQNSLIAKIQDTGLWLDMIDTSQKVYKFFLHKSGTIKTIFPKG